MTDAEIADLRKHAQERGSELLDSALRDKPHCIPISVLHGNLKRLLKSAALSPAEPERTE